MSTLIDGSSNVSIDTSTGAPRITGDFSNATIANRVMFQTSTTNGNSYPAVIPNGTGASAFFETYNSSNPANAGGMGVGVDAGVAYLNANIKGTGTYLPMTFYTGGAERMRIATDGVITAGAGNVLLVSGTAQASTSGTSIDFTDIPSWVKRITVMFAGVSTNGTSNPLIQLGDSGGIEATGYTAASMYSSGDTTYTTGFGFGSGLAANVIYGSLVLSLQNSATNTWIAHGDFTSANIGVNVVGGKSLSATLDRVRITTVNGTDTFDAGSINILYE